MARLLKVGRSSLAAVAVLLGIAALVVIAYAAATPSRSAGEGGVVIEERKLVRLPEARLNQIMAGAEVAELQQLQQYYFTDGTPHIRIGNREYPLAPLADQEYAPTAEEAAGLQSMAAALQMYGQYVMGGPIVVGQAAVSAAATPPPPVVDHRSKQTPVKDQGDRWTDISFASIAALEAAYGGGSLDLSEQYAQCLLMQAVGEACGNPRAVACWANAAADVLWAHGVSRESVCPYYPSLGNLIPYCIANLPGRAQRADAEAHSPYRIEGFWKLWRNSDLETDTGFYINNPRCLEALLASGDDIVLETGVAGWTPPLAGVIVVKKSGGIWTPYGPLSPEGRQTVLVVGYQHQQDSRHPYGGGYFIAKNSWGTDVGHDGYLYLSYNYIRTYALCGYVIREVVRPHLQQITTPAASRPGRSSTPRRSR